jgi:hypothetical protein
VLALSQASLSPIPKNEWYVDPSNSVAADLVGATIAKLWFSPFSLKKCASTLIT